MNTHYAVIAFGGDFDNDHPDPDLRGQAPSLTLIGAGPEEFCWDTLRRWTMTHPLRRDEMAEVLSRDPQVVTDQQTRARSFISRLFDPPHHCGDEGCTDEHGHTP